MLLRTGQVFDGEAYAMYGGWRKGADPDPARVLGKKESFRLALEEGAPMCFGGGVGVFDRGDNVCELELMEEYGMPAIDALRTATSGNARILGLGERPGRDLLRLLAPFCLFGGPGVPVRVSHRKRAL